MGRRTEGQWERTSKNAGRRTSELQKAKGQKRSHVTLIDFINEKNLIHMEYKRGFE